jgi:hypothetical protein
MISRPRSPSCRRGIDGPADDAASCVSGSNSGQSSPLRRYVKFEPNTQTSPRQAPQPPPAATVQATATDVRPSRRLPTASSSSPFPSSSAPRHRRGANVSDDKASPVRSTAKQFLRGSGADAKLETMTRLKQKVDEDVAQLQEDLAVSRQHLQEREQQVCCCCICIDCNVNVSL